MNHTPEPINNLILKKICIALDLKNQDVKELVELGGISLSRSRVKSFFVNAASRHYVTCNDRVINAFFVGLSVMKGHLRPYLASATYNDYLKYIAYYHDHTEESI